MTSESFDDLPFDYPVEERVATAPPRKCRHPKRSRMADDEGWYCGRCSHRFDPVVVRRGAAARRAGKRAERRVNAAAGLRNVGGANGPEDGIDERFAAQSKSFNSRRYPGWMLEELDALRTTSIDGGDVVGLVRAASAGRVPILLVGENPGRGRKRRETLVVMRFDDWLATTRLETPSETT